VSAADQVLFREANATDMPGISHVRLSVIENALSVEQLQERGITNASVAASLLTHRKGWVAEQNGRIVAFSMADRADWSIFALFVLPGYEQRGLGGRLLDLALDWLWENGAERVWLSTGPQTWASRFYEMRGWVCTGNGAGDDLRFELSRPASPAQTGRCGKSG
jgi:GNAT superfamily N-acetyltransferase